MSAPIVNRYEFVYLFDVENGNPNGDPDAGNMPRIDPETHQGLVTDVCLKRKVRNFVELTKEGEGEERFNIYVREKAVLNHQHQKAYESTGIKQRTKKLPKEEAEAEQITAWMCHNFFDVRTFGAVMTTKVNCGQVRGPIQLNFSRSIEPILPLEISITRMAVTKEEDLEKERTMGRKHIVPYALYRCEGYISAALAGKSGFDEDDLQLFWQALEQMFDHDRSAARGKMSPRRLIVFRHDSKLGNAPAHKLFDLVDVSRKNGDDDPARCFGDYQVTVDAGRVPEGVTLEEKI
jgi:CRISPR-associated protein Csd2